QILFLVFLCVTVRPAQTGFAVEVSYSAMKIILEEDTDANCLWSPESRTRPNHARRSRHARRRTAAPLLAAGRHIQRRRRHPETHPRLLRRLDPLPRRAGPARP